MRALAAWSDATNPADAVLEIGARLREQGYQAERAGAALVFASSHHGGRPEALSRALSDALGPVPFVGWVGESVFFGLRLAERTPGLVVLILEDTEGYVRSTSQVGLGSLVAAELVADAPVGSLRFLSAPVDGFDSANLLPALDEQSAPVLGGLCIRATPASALAPGITKPGQAALLSVRGVRPVVSIGQGGRIIGRADAHCDPRRREPAVRGRRAARSGSADGRPTPARCGRKPRGFAGACCWASRATTRAACGACGRSPVSTHGRALLRCLRSPARARRWCSRCVTARSARSDLEEALISLKGSLAGRKPVAVVLFNCSLRNEQLLGIGQYDIGRVDDMLGAPGIPTVGVSGAGELCTWDANTQLFSNSAVVAALLPEDS